MTRILITGRGVSGSWKIRGQQLGAAIGATVEPDAVNFTGYDCAVIVKRPSQDKVRLLHRAKVPIVWDVVDAWPQPHGNDWNREQCMDWLRGQVHAIRPLGIVAATQAMARDCYDFGIPVLALPHHARPDQALNPIRDQVKVVGYEGGNYLGRWHGVIVRLCKQRGWSFHVNPAALADVDIVVAMREAMGYAARQWKSNVKLANAQGSGTPCIVGSEAGYVETCSGAELFADTEDELDISFSELSDWEVRGKAAAHMRCARPMLGEIAATYKAWLQALKS